MEPFAICSVNMALHSLAFNQIPTRRTDQENVSIRRSVKCAWCGFALHQSLPLMREVARRSRDGGIAMQSKHNKQLVPFAKQLRKEMTKEERHLRYDFLRTYPVRFSRQKVLGRDIVKTASPRNIKNMEVSLCNEESESNGSAFFSALCCF